MSSLSIKLSNSLWQSNKKTTSLKHSVIYMIRSLWRKLSSSAINAIKLSGWPGKCVKQISQSLICMVACLKRSVMLLWTSSEAANQECWSQLMCGVEVWTCNKYHWLFAMTCLSHVSCISIESVVQVASTEKVSRSTSWRMRMWESWGISSSTTRLRSKRCHSISTS